MKQAKVLIVDDARDLADSLANLVEMHGCQAITASNGQEAVERFREHDIDITFMDVRMPVMNGVDSFFAIRALRPDAKVVLMTGFREPIAPYPQSQAPALYPTCFAAKRSSDERRDGLPIARGICL